MESEKSISRITRNSVNAQSSLIPLKNRQKSDKIIFAKAVHSYIMKELAQAKFITYVTGGIFYEVSC